MRFAATLVLVWTLLLAAVGTARASARSITLVSDIHFGVGKAAGGGWDSYEDFRWHEDFKAFLAAVDQKGAGKTDLVLNGDTFELWQSRTVACAYANADWGCSERDAAERFRRVLDQHRATISELEAFAMRGDNRVYLVPGNHDAALFFPKVAALWKAAVKGAGSRVILATNGQWLSTDGLIRADHGHQIGADVNAFSQWPSPLVRAQGGPHVVKSWGEQLVQSFYNQYEDKYPIIDNLSSEAAGVRFGLKLEGTHGAAVGAGKFLKFLALEESWSQFGQVLSTKTGQPPKWDYDAIRKQGVIFIRDSFPSGDALRQLVPAGGAGGAGVPDAIDLTNEEIDSLCALRTAGLKKGLKLTSCPATSLGSNPGSLGAIASSVVQSRDQAIRAHLASTKVQVFVYSHTHKVDEFRVGQKLQVLNTGAFQRLASPEWLAAAARRRGLTPEAAFAKFQPEDLNPCYSFVWIGPYEGMPKGQLLKWAAVGGKWQIRNGKCE